MNSIQKYSAVFRLTLKRLHFIIFNHTCGIFIATDRFHVDRVIIRRSTDMICDLDDLADDLDDE